MVVYSERFTLTLSDTVKDIAAKVGKGFDPDTAGEYSFTDNGDGTISTSTPCEAQFKADAELLMTDANMLYYVMQQKYAERWQDLTPPTLAECQTFIAAIIKATP